MGRGVVSLVGVPYPCGSRCRAVGGESIRKNLEDELRSKKSALRILWLFYRVRRHLRFTCISVLCITAVWAHIGWFTQNCRGSVPARLSSRAVFWGRVFAVKQPVGNIIQIPVSIIFRFVQECLGRQCTNRTTRALKKQKHSCNR